MLIKSSNHYKIYVLKFKDNYLYVGKTKQTIGTKLGQGFRSYRKDKEGKKEANYGGYKWIKKSIEEKRILELFVFDLGINKQEQYAEAIEAEVVFIIRTEHDRWPEGQNEIHFYNTFVEARTKALEIYQLTKDYSNHIK